MPQLKVCGTVLMVFLLGSTGAAHAGVIDSVMSWVTGEALAFILSAAAAMLAGMSGILYRKVSNTMKEAGEFLTTLGSALEDNRITREELASIVKEGRDIFTVWT